MREIRGTLVEQIHYAAARSPICDVGEIERALGIDCYCCGRAEVCGFVVVEKIVEVALWVVDGNAHLIASVDNVNDSVVGDGHTYGRVKALVGAYGVSFETGSRSDLNNAVVAFVDDVKVVEGIDGERDGVAEGSRADGAVEGGAKARGSARGALNDAVVPAVGDEDIALVIYSHAFRVVEGEAA